VAENVIEWRRFCYISASAVYEKPPLEEPLQDSISASFDASGWELLIFHSSPFFGRGPEREKESAGGVTATAVNKSVFVSGNVGFF